jgi:hypothetical protein
VLELGAELVDDFEDDDDDDDDADVDDLLLLHPTADTLTSNEVAARPATPITAVFIAMSSYPFASPFLEKLNRAQRGAQWIRRAP